MPGLTEVDRHRALGLPQAGLPISEVSLRMNVNRTTIFRIRQRLHETDTVSDRPRLRINDLPYNQSSYNPKEFSGPEVIMLRLDVSGLESIRIWKEGENGTMMPGALYAGHACAGIKGFSGFCSDLEARHSTKLRLVK
ncbi:hypothetical protein ElyMa_005429400 [Elysia marginata]|uniref:Uncharacterized protein n=1 Tax=Elysia marginata TaxID=1093978 RepID=A0AAV4EKI2_9GAST|nr:hypothetical protein ElyMa_005429400 [Elysia marginata]